MQMSLKTSEVRENIEVYFPSVPMPQADELAFHSSACMECDCLAQDLEQYRHVVDAGELVRLLHQELSHLSAAGWKWILPIYLRYCLTEEAAFNKFETEFLAYNLSPSLRFQKDTIERLSFVSDEQLKVLIGFLQWLLLDSYWVEFCGERIEAGVKFLCELDVARQNKAS